MLCVLVDVFVYIICTCERAVEDYTTRNEKKRRKKKKKHSDYNSNIVAIGTIGRGNRLWVRVRECVCVYIIVFVCACVGCECVRAWVYVFLPADRFTFKRNFFVFCFSSIFFFSSFFLYAWTMAIFLLTRNWRLRKRKKRHDTRWATLLLCHYQLSLSG